MHTAPQAPQFVGSVSKSTHAPPHMRPVHVDAPALPPFGALAPLAPPIGAPAAPDAGAVPAMPVEPDWVPPAPPVPGCADAPPDAESSSPEGAGWHPAPKRVAAPSRSTFSLLTQVAPVRIVTRVPCIASEVESPKTDSARQQCMKRRASGPQPVTSLVPRAPKFRQHGKFREQSPEASVSRNANSPLYTPRSGPHTGSSPNPAASTPIRRSSVVPS